MKINFPAHFATDPKMVAKRAAAPAPLSANPNPATPAPTDKPHYNLVDGEFFNVESF